MSIDEMINEWLLEKFRKEYQREIPGYDKEKHLRVCETTRTENITCEWDCGCYSCYTRDDSFVMTTKIICDCGVEANFHYGYWGDLPDFIMELDEYKNNTCLHADDCEDC